MIRTISYSVILTLFPLLTALAKPTVVVTNRALELIVKEVAAEDVIIFTLLAGGVDPHTFEARPSQLQQVAKADLLFANGGELEPWLSKVNARRSLLMKGDLNTGGAFWLNPNIVKSSIASLVEILCEVEHSKCEVFKARGDRFIETLEVLTQSLRARVSKTSVREFFVYHDLYQSLAEAFDLKFFGDLKSCEIDTQTADQIAALVSKIQQQKIDTIFVEDEHDLENLGAFEELKLKSKVLDPYGVKANSYTDLMNSLFDALGTF